LQPDAGHVVVSEGDAPQPRTLDRLDLISVAAIIAVLSAVYSWRMLHGMGFYGDAIKFQFIGPTAGVGHETGNPIYLVLIWLASRVPIGDVGTRVNATSAVVAIVACVLLFFALRELAVRRSIAVAFSIGLGVVPAVALYAVVAEVHTLHLTLTVAILLTLLMWERRRSDRYLYVLVALVAVSLGNHVTTVLLIPGILVFLWKVDWKKAFTVKTAAAAVVGVIGAALSYYYLVWRAADPSTFYLELMPRSFTDLVDMWLGGRYRGTTMFDVDFAALVTELGPYVLALFAVSFAVLILPIGVGFRAMRKTSIRATLVLWTVFTSLFVVAIGGGVGWIDPYLIPLMMIVIVFASVGAERLASRHAPSQFVMLGLLVTTVVLIAAPFTAVFAWTDWSEEAIYQEDVRMWMTMLPSDSVLALEYRDAMAVWYMMAIEHVETDVEVLHIDGYDIDSDWYLVLDDYLGGDPGYAWQLRQPINPGQDVFAPSDRWMCELVGAGFGLTPYRQHMYRVVTPRGALPLEERWTMDMESTCAALASESD
jgi:hypothetical protein